MYWRNYMLICLSLLQLCNKKYRALCRIRIKNHLWINWSLLPGSSLVAGSCQRRETKASRRLLQKDNSRWQESISVTPNQERTNTSQFRLLQRRHCLSELLLFLFHMLLWNLASVLKTHINMGVSFLSNHWVCLDQPPFLQAYCPLQLPGEEKERRKEVLSFSPWRQDACTLLKTMFNQVQTRH